MHAPREKKIICEIVFAKTLPVPPILKPHAPAAHATASMTHTPVRHLPHVPDPSIDNAAGTLTIKGTVDQLGLAEWLVPKLDVADGADPDPQEYRAPGNSDDVVAVLGVVHSSTVYGVQEICAILRSVANLRAIAPVVFSRLVVLRDSATQVALAESLLPKLDVQSQSRQEIR